MESTTKFSGWRVLIGCFLVMFFVQGGLQTLAIFLPSIAEGVGVHLSAIALISTFATIAAFAANLLIGPLIKKINIRWVLFFGLICFSGHFYIYSVAHQLVWLYISAAIGGLAAGFGTIGPVSVVMTNWFVKSRATFMSIIVAGSMFGGALLLPLSGWLISTYGWRHAYVILATSVLVIIAFAVFVLIVDKPESLGQKPYGADDAPAASPGATTAKPAEIGGVTAAEARRTPSFWLLIVGILLIGCSTNIENFLPAFWQSKGLSVVDSSNIMGIYAFVAGVIAMLLGKVTDKMGGKAYTLLTSVMFMLGTVLILLIGAAAMPMMLLGLIPFSMGAKKTSIMTSPLVVAESFGRKHYGQLIGYFAAMLQLGIALSNPIIGGLLRHTGDFSASFYAMAGINGVALILVIASMVMAPYKPAAQQA